VNRRHLTMLIGLALIWGASFMFIKVGVRELSPATLVLGRVGLAALTLAVVVPLVVGGKQTVAELRANAGWLVVVALVNTAIPFWLLSWGETRIDSGLASIIQASVPIFVALISFGWFREVRVTGCGSSAPASGSSASFCSSAPSRAARCSARWRSSAWRSVTRSEACSWGGT
jgi:EamA-like transporter family.